MSYIRRRNFSNTALCGFAAFALLVLISTTQVFAQANARTEVATDQCRPREKTMLLAFNKTEPRQSRPGETENCSAETADEEASAINPVKEFIDRITEPDLGGGESDDRLRLRPEVFIQGRLGFAPLRSGDDESNLSFNFTRLQVEWGGRVHARVGVGFELQFESLIEREHEEIISDAFLDFYLTENITVRAGQFNKPFGFDVQQSSTVRESPERGMFAGYFFPGEVETGVMFTGNLNFLGRTARGLSYSAGVFRGSLFQARPEFNYVARLRKVFEGAKFAMGVSMQRGKQHLLEGAGTSRKNLVGADFQYVVGRVGIRGEFVAGHAPASMFEAAEELEDSFDPGADAAGGALVAVYRLTQKDNLYGRYDQFNGDPAAGRSIRAFNFGYFRSFGRNSRLNVDCQFKNRRSFQDDAANDRFQITWSTIF